MIGVLFGANIILALLSGLAIAMVQHHFNRIEKSIRIYGDPKAYKPRSNIVFIETVINTIRELGEKELKGEYIQRIIHQCFMEQKIGYFSCKWTQNIAIKGKFIMWVILGIQIAIEILGKSPGNSVSNFIFIVGSTLLCLFFSLVGIVKNIGEYRMNLLCKVQDYIMNTYPVELANKNKSKDIQELLDKIDKIDIGIESTEQNKVASEIGLKETDIRVFLQRLDKDA